MNYDAAPYPCGMQDRDGGLRQEANQPYNPSRKGAMSRAGGPLFSLGLQLRQGLAGFL